MDLVQGHVDHIRCPSGLGGDIVVDGMTTSGAKLAAVSGCVRGRVQGVAFRYTMQRVAAGLGVTGWVRNLPDRSVAFHAEGPQDALDALLQWTQSGPAEARVDEVDAEPCIAQRFGSFEILP